MLKTHIQCQCNILKILQDTHQTLETFGNSGSKSLLASQLRYEEQILRSTHLVRSMCPAYEPRKIHKVNTSA